MDQPYALFLDDQRNPPTTGENWVLCRTVEAMRQVLADRGAPTLASFDFDLEKSETHLTGQDALQCFLDALRSMTDFPESIEVRFHSSSEPHRRLMADYLQQRQPELAAQGIPIQCASPSGNTDAYWSLIRP